MLDLLSVSSNPVYVGPAATSLLGTRRFMWQGYSYCIPHGHRHRATSTQAQLWGHTVQAKTGLYKNTCQTFLWFAYFSGSRGASYKHVLPSLHPIPHPTSFSLMSYGSLTKTFGLLQCSPGQFKQFLNFHNLTLDFNYPFQQIISGMHILLNA